MLTMTKAILSRVQFCDYIYKCEKKLLVCSKHYKLPFLIQITENYACLTMSNDCFLLTDEN